MIFGYLWTEFFLSKAYDHISEGQYLWNQTWFVYVQRELFIFPPLEPSSGTGKISSPVSVKKMKNDSREKSESTQNNNRKTLEMVTIQVNMWDFFLILKIFLKHNVLLKQKS